MLICSWILWGVDRRRLGESSDYIRGIEERLSIQDTLIREFKESNGEYQRTVTELRGDKESLTDTYQQLREDYQRLDAAYRQLTNLNQQSGGIVGELRKRERDHSERLKQLEQLLEKMRKKD